MKAKHKAAIAIVAIFGLVGSFSSGAVADTPVDDHLLTWNNNNMPAAYTQVLAWTDSNTQTLPFSIDPFDSRLNSVGQAVVNNSFSTVLDVCSASLTTGCLSSVEYSLDDGKSWQKAIQQTSPGQRDIAFGGGTLGVDVYTSTYDANPAKGILRAAQPAYWELPDAKTSIGNHYFINAAITSRMDSSGVAKIQGIEFTAYAGEARLGGIRGCNYWQVNTKHRTESGYCFEGVNVPSNLTLRVKANLGSRISELSGWFDGRLADAVVDMGTTEPGVLTVQGKATRVNAVQTNPIKKGEALYDVDPAIEQVQLPYGTRGGLTPKDGISRFLVYKDYIPEKATFSNNIWRLNSWQESTPIGACARTQGVQGIVLTNATTYESKAPVLDPATGALNFKVASAHLNTDGTVQEGTYQLFVQDALAKCLWGNLSTGSATISVTDSGGAQNVATTSFGQANGWAVFRALGFHFSTPQISVKFNAPKPKTSTIVCYKVSNKKITKSITAAKPTCPAGFKLQVKK